MQPIGVNEKNFNRLIQVDWSPIRISLSKPLLEVETLLTLQPKKYAELMKHML